MFWSCYASGVSVSWHQWYHKWYHCLSKVKTIKKVEQHNIFGHVMPWVLMSASHDTYCIINGTIPILGQDYQNQLQPDFLVMWCHCINVASHAANGIKNGTPAFVRSRQLKWSAASHFGHVMPLVLVSVSYDTDSTVNVTTAFLRSRWSKWHDLFGHFLTMTPVSA